MSLRDLEQNRNILAAFKGRRCFGALAINSLKLHIDENRSNGRYIWIDPPWFFSRAWEEIDSADGYSEHDFKKWCERFSALRETVLEGFEEREDGAITFLFLGGHRLFVPVEVDSEEENESWYDHWYASDKKDI